MGSAGTSGGRPAYGRVNKTGPGEIETNRAAKAFRLECRYPA